MVGSAGPQPRTVRAAARRARRHRAWQTLLDQFEARLQQTENGKKPGICLGTPIEKLQDVAQKRDRLQQQVLLLTEQNAELLERARNLDAEGNKSTGFSPEF